MASEMAARGKRTGSRWQAVVAGGKRWQPVASGGQPMASEGGSPWQARV